MKQKEWTDCPSCGAVGSMRLKRGRHKSFEDKKSPPIKIGPLSEYVCRECSDGVYTISSNNLIEAKLAEHRARHDAATTVIADVIQVAEASKMLKMTRQGVIQLMKRGKLPYVFFGKTRVPKRQAVMEYAAA